MFARRILLAVLLLVLASTGYANLCGLGQLNDRYRTEAGQAVAQAFSPPDYHPTIAEYDGWILACNRKRDSHGNKLDQLISASSADTFGADLPVKMVKGRLEFLDGVVTKLKYAYQLQRDSGEWTLTLAVRMEFPERPIANRLDIAADLAVPLGLMTAPNGAAGTLPCDLAQVQLADGVRTRVDLGRIDTFDGFGCRLPRDRLLANGEKLLDHFYLFWKSAIEQAWNRPGFRVNVVFTEYTSPLFAAATPATLTAFDKANAVWKIGFSNNPNKRATYKQVPFKWENAPMALAGATIAHETGHFLGLDDEYREKDRGVTNEWRDCDQHGGSGYLMCDQTFADDSSPENDPGGIANPEAAKGIYAWIITRRYAIGEAPECASDADCGALEYCDRGGVLALAKNVCAVRLGECDACDRNSECSSGNCTLQRCVVSTVKPLGAFCCRNAQCASDNCSRQGLCQCRRNADCPSGQKCREGFLGIGLNRCE